MFDEMRAHGKGYRVVGGLVNTDKIMRDTFWIGLYPGMQEDMLAFMAGIIKRYIADLIIQTR